MLVDQVHNIIKIIWYQVSGIRYHVPNMQPHQTIPLNQEPEAGCVMLMVDPVPVILWQTFASVLFVQKTVCSN